MINRIAMKVKSKLVEYFLPIFNHRVFIGKGLNLRKNVNLNCNGGELIIGRYAFINSNSTINVREKIEIGNYFLAGENVHIYDHNHKFSDLKMPIADQGFKTAPIKIGNNVWLGSNVTILGGVSIGDNCVIGANCLIYKDVPCNMVVKCNQGLVYEERI